MGDSQESQYLGSSPVEPPFSQAVGADEVEQVAVEVVVGVEEVVDEVAEVAAPDKPDVVLAPATPPADSMEETDSDSTWEAFAHAAKDAAPAAKSICLPQPSSP